MNADRIKNITGIYVPFWLYDLDNDVEVRGYATKLGTYRRGDYIYTETHHFEIYRRIRLNYVRLPVDASEKMNDKLMDRLEPYPYDQLNRSRPHTSRALLLKNTVIRMKSFFPAPRRKSGLLSILTFHQPCRHFILYALRKTDRYNRQTGQVRPFARVDGVL